MTRPRLVVVDADGTLLRRDGRVSRRTRAVIIEARRAGVTVTLGTGRPVYAAFAIARRAGIAGVPVIACNGAVVSESATGRFIYHRTIDPADALRMLEWLRDAPVYERMYLGRAAYMQASRWRAVVRGWLEQIRRPADLVRLVRFYVSERIRFVHDLASFLAAAGRGPEKFFVFGGGAQVAEVFRGLAERMQGRVYMARAGWGSFEVNHPEATKGTGLRVLAAHLGVPCEETMAIGDGFNDLPMLEQAGFSVAMGNAPAEVKERVHAVTGSNEEDGVAEAIARFVLHPVAASRSTFLVGRGRVSP